MMRWERAPRGLGLLFAGFLALFAFDVFGGELSGAETAVAFVVHLAPAFLVGGSTMIGWRWPLAGALGFLCLAGAYMLLSWGRLPLATVLMLCGPAVAIGLLFMASAFRLPRR